MIKNNVLIGKENWLFLYNGGQKQFDFLRGVEKVSNKSVENFTHNIASRVDYFKSQAIAYKHVVFPSKPLLKERFIPKDFNDISSLFINSYQNRLDSYCNSVIYPLKELKTLEEGHSTFYKYDTHNTDYGFLEIVNILLRSLNLEKIPLHYYHCINNKVRGDLAEMLNIFDKHEEEFLHIKAMQAYGIDNRQFLPGNTNNVQIIHNNDAITTKRLLIFGDSFFKGTLKFLKIYFTDILYIRSTFIHKDIVENFQPDVVLSGNAERYLCNVESDTQSNNFLLELYGQSKFKPSKEYLEALNANISYKNYNHVYQDWIKKINEKTFNFQIKIDKSFHNPDILREVSLYFEEKGDIDTAYNLMKEALRLRPQGPFLQKKVQQYKQERLKWE